MAKCAIDECKRDAVCRGWCNIHYCRWKRNGSPDVCLSPEKTPDPVVIKATDAEIAWMAGIIEGEGSFCMGGYKRRQLHIRVGMCDEDVVLKLRTVSGIGTISLTKTTHGRAFYVWTVCRLPEVVAIIGRLLPWLGQRRRCRATELLQKAESLALVREKCGPKQKISHETISEIRSAYASGNVSQNGLARAYGISAGSVNAIVRGKSYREVQPCH